MGCGSAGADSDETGLCDLPERRAHPHGDLPRVCNVRLAGLSGLPPCSDAPRGSHNVWSHHADIPGAGAQGFPPYRCEPTFKIDRMPDLGGHRLASPVEILRRCQLQRLQNVESSLCLNFMLLLIGIKQPPSEQDIGFWREAIGVARAPALVFLRGPGAERIVHEAGAGATLDVAALAEKYAWPVRQLSPIKLIFCRII